MKILFILLLAVTGFQCSDNKNGWAQSDKDKLVSSCIKEAKARNTAADDTTLQKYCSCYQQNLEKQYPDIKQIEKAEMAEILKAAENCVQILIK